MDRSEGARIAGLVAVLGLAAWLRWPGLAEWYHTEEVALVWTRGAAAAWADAEVGANPPLLKLASNALFSGEDVLRAARGLAFGCGLGAVALAFLQGERAARGAGLLAAWLAAVHPESVAYAAIARPYTPALLLSQVHLLAAQRLARPERAGRVPMVGLALTALVLPWLHYLTVPLLALTGAGLLVRRETRARILLYVPGALAFLPLLDRILDGPGFRLPPAMSVLETAVLLLSLGLERLPSPLRKALPAAWQGPAAADLGMVHAALAGVVLLLALRHLRDPDRRVPWVWAVGGVVAITLAGLEARVRTPAVILVLPGMLPLVGASTAGLRGWGRHLATLLVAAWVVLSAWYPLTHRRVWPGRDAPPQVAERLADWEDLRAGRDVTLAPTSLYASLYFAWEGQPITGPRRPETRCETDDPIDLCFVHEGVLFRPMLAGTRPDGLMIRSGKGPVPEGCTLVRSEEVVELLDCHR